MKRANDSPYRDWGLAAMFRDMNGDGIPICTFATDNVSPDRIWLIQGGHFARSIRGLFAIPAV